MKAEKTRETIDRCTFAGENIKFGEDVELYAELDKLEAKAVKWDDPQIQSDLELARAVKAAFKVEDTELIVNLDMCCDTMTGWEKRCFDTQQIMDWYKEQQKCSKVQYY